MNITFLRTLTDIFYPRRCPVCDRAVRPFGSLVCETCQSEFVRIRQPYCLKCGKELSAETELSIEDIVMALDANVEVESIYKSVYQSDGKKRI